MIRLILVLTIVLISDVAPVYAQLGNPLCDNVGYARIHGLHFATDGAAMTPIFTHYYACDLTTQVNINCWHPSNHVTDKELDGLWCTVFSLTDRDEVELAEDELFITPNGEFQTVRMIEVASELVTAGYHPLSGGSYERMLLVFAPGITLSDLPARITYTGPGMSDSLYFTATIRSNLPGT